MHTIFNIEKNHIFHIYLLNIQSLDINSIVWFSKKKYVEQDKFKQDLRNIEKRLKKLRGTSLHTLTKPIIIDSKYLLLISKYPLEEKMVNEWKEKKYFMNYAQSEGPSLWNIITMLCWNEKIPE